MASSAQVNARIIEALYDYGHFANPVNQDGHAIRRADLPKLTLGDKVCKAALLSFQQIMGMRVDGVAGPITVMELFNVSRCGCPDYGVLTEDGEVVAAATGRGGWPHSCRPGMSGIHAISVSWNMSGCPSFLQPHFETVWSRVVAMYADIGLLLIREDGNSSANLQASFNNLRGSTIGLAIVPGRPPTCGMSIWCRYDPSYRPRNVVNEWTTLIAHEIGHNQRLEHTRGGIMNPGIINGLPASWRNDPSFGQLADQYGGEPVDNPDQGDEFLREIVLRGSRGGERVLPIPTQVKFDESQKFMLEMLK